MEQRVTIECTAQHELDDYLAKLTPTSSGTVVIPDSLTLSGDIHTLPDKLSVSGGIYLDNCTAVTSLPESLSVSGACYLYSCTEITSLPESLKVGGYLDLTGCTGLTSLPENLSVSGYLDLRDCTGLVSLPDNLSVDGIFYLADDQYLVSVNTDSAAKHTNIIDISSCKSLHDLLDVRHSQSEVEAKDAVLTYIMSDRYMKTLSPADAGAFLAASSKLANIDIRDDLLKITRDISSTSKMKVASMSSSARKTSGI